MTREHLRVVRDSAPPPRLELPRLERPSPPPVRWYDSPWFGAVLMASMFILAGVLALALKWARP